VNLRVEAHARLHLGFLDPAAGESSRRFGGLGFALEAPRFVLTVAKAEGLRVEGPHADRVEVIAERVHRLLELKPRLHIVVEEAIPEHVGLGSGTQQALALATAIARQRHLDAPVARLSALTGRARRSGVGFHLFRLGGFVVEGGHAAVGRGAGDVPPLLARHEMPEDWRVVVALPETTARISGEAEEEAFRRLKPADDRTVDRIARAVLTGLLPALVERDLAAFGRALARTQELVGACFAPVQEGEFHPAAAALVRALKKAGACGVGQSSWGPAVYAFAADEREEERIVGLVRAADPRAAVLRTRACNRGARVNGEAIERPATSG
jgi:beta-RFAP synthase